MLTDKLVQCVDAKGVETMLAQGEDYYVYRSLGVVCCGEAHRIVDVGVLRPATCVNVCGKCGRTPPELVGDPMAWFFERRFADLEAVVSLDAILEGIEVAVPA